MKVIVASTNPVKIKATKSAFRKVFPKLKIKVEGIEVDSGVSDQPKSDQETLKGAFNRSLSVSKSQKADYFVGLEGGIEKKDKEIVAFAWMVVVDRKGRIGKAKTASFVLPEAINKLLLEGKELGEATDIVFKAHNSKKKGGTVGFLTDNAIDRALYYTHALILALIPFKNKTLYFV